MEEKFMSLITDYMDGTLTPDREREFQQYVEEGHIDLKEIEGLLALDEKIQTATVPEPSAQLSERFYTSLAEAQKAEANTADWSSFFTKLNQMLFGQASGRWAFGLVILVVGVVFGRLLGGGQYEQQLTNLTSQMSEMQEMMMVSMLEKESVSERLKGVQMSNELVSTNKTVTDALFVTLNNDESTNVRMAALNTLAAYANDAAIREGLINSISQQQSPLMQLALAELMVDLQEKRSIEKFRELLGDENTPEEIKTTLQQSIDKMM